METLSLAEFLKKPEGTIFAEVNDGVRREPLGSKGVTIFLNGLDKPPTGFLFRQLAVTFPLSGEPSLNYVRKWTQERPEARFVVLWPGEVTEMARLLEAG